MLNPGNSGQLELLSGTDLGGPSEDRESVIMSVVFIATGNDCVSLVIGIIAILFDTVV